MAQTAARQSFGDRIGWNDRIKPWLVRLAFAAVAFLVGLYIAAPTMQARQPTHLPASFVALPHGAVGLVHADGTGTLLPVRIADTTTARNEALRGVGEQAIEGHVVLYALTRETSSRASYSTQEFRAPMDFAAVDAQGAVTAIHRTSSSGERIAIPEPHRWVLVAKAGALERLGIDVGSSLDPESVRKF